MTSTRKYIFLWRLCFTYTVEAGELGKQIAQLQKNYESR
jgi:hypothetical protein